MRYLITGASGFVGAYLINHLRQEGHGITGIDVNPPSEHFSSFYCGIDFIQMSLMEYEPLKSVLEKFLPDRIIHLASASSVAISWQAPLDCFMNNTNIFLHLLEAVRKIKLDCHILSVGSSEEYGPVSVKEMPLKESQGLNPISPYAVARVAQEHLSHVYLRGYGIDIICTRSFNHIGPGQSERFVVSSFVRQAVEVAKGKKKEIACGDVSIVRDFIDVRDVIRAYLCILDHGHKGDVYNVCSGQGHSLKEIIDCLCRMLKIPSVFKTSASLIRPIENPIVIGDNTKISHLGFKPVYGLNRSLDDMISWWSDRIV